MKILHFTIAASRGGRTQYIYNLAKHIDRRVFQIDFITFSESMKDASDFKELGSVYYISSYPERDREGFTEQFNHVLENGYDVVELHTGLWKSLLVEQLVKKANVKKIIIHSHATSAYLGINDINRIGLEEARTQHEMIKQQISASIATDFWACSWSAADWLYGDRIPKERIQIIYNAVDTNRFRYCRQVRSEYRERYGIAEKFVVGFVGRFESVKNIPFLLSVIKKLQKVKNNIVLLMVGDGSLEEELKRLAVDMEIDNYVIWAGRQKNTEAFYNMMDVLCLPSFSEAFPITLIEAQSTGLPCVCSDACSSETEATNLVERVSINNVDAWVEKLQIIETGYERVERSDELAEAGFDIQSMVKKIEKLYLA